MQIFSYFRKRKEKKIQKIIDEFNKYLNEDESMLHTKLMYRTPIGYSYEPVLDAMCLVKKRKKDGTFPNDVQKEINDLFRFVAERHMS